MLVCAVQQMGHILYVLGGGKGGGFMSSSLKQLVFNFYVSITFLRINFCSSVHHLLSPSILKRICGHVEWLNRRNKTSTNVINSQVSMAVSDACDCCSQVCDLSSVRVQLS